MLRRGLGLEGERSGSVCSGERWDRCVPFEPWSWVNGLLGNAMSECLCYIAM